MMPRPPLLPERRASLCSALPSVAQHRSIPNSNYLGSDGLGLRSEPTFSLRGKKSLKNFKKLLTKYY